MDINNAFLQANLHKEVYVTQPEGFINPDCPRHVFQLKRVLYSLRQAPLAWNHTLNAFLIGVSFIATQADPCLYTLHNHHTNHDGNTRPYNPKLHQVFVQTTANSQPHMILSIYINYLLITGMPADVNMVKEQLQNQFHIKDFGPISTILGIDITYDATTSTLDISQKQKIMDLATEFKLTSAKPLRCPLPARTDLHVIESTLHAHASLKFHQLISTLLYIALATCPDILHTVVYLS